MAFDVYFKEDILNALRSVYAANEGAAGLACELLQDPDLQGVELTRLMQIYRRGFVTALGAVGLAFGLDALPVSSPSGRTRLPEPQRQVASPVDGRGEWSEAQAFGFLWQMVSQRHND